ncbi:leucyl aminopeptidase [Cupriavidus sp. USMAA2-4]|uniref:Probable cytosol aminopeptidase n=1 Tax=Cupriavidus malaysiensis TaxID=367825 RepID=A0ABN4TKG6_9BURK|nr:MULTISPECIES: leucyl aminopeptidase [Cupriavidus]AOY92943.1 leucyl aminopeptidase [Cupriavidus sp. USMAA2-4]AOZ00640.1 leucyl aminopeptidase [Cupriavidus sp. USMAHM13]AOZ07398.1 leucyl aminopeptidase [Cupriavidus malaysiensis]
MEFSTKALDWSKAGQNGFLATKTDCLVVGLFEGQSLDGAAKALDVATKGLVARLLKQGDFEGKRGTHLMLHEVAGVGAARVLLVGLGKESAFSDKAYVDAVRAAVRAVSDTRSASALWCLHTQHLPPGRDLAWGLVTTVTLLREATYRLLDRHPELKPAAVKGAGGNGNGKSALRKVVIAVDAGDAKAAAAAVLRGAAIANGVELARDLGNLPSNVCTPTYLANTARGIAKRFKLKVEVLGRKQIEALNMGAFLAVTKGSVEPPQFIVLRYEGAGARQAPVVLVGKGITFDTGGISLKPGEGMDEMKYDMCGAASVLGTLQAVAEMGLKLNVIAVVPTCENMPSGIATKPGDVVTTMSGQTVEILNTDAEGRLILCDALTYVERFKPAAVVDVATLTGACIIALGHVNSGLFSRSDALADQLLAAGRKALDSAWRLPLDDEYQDQLKSNFADMANIGGRPAGSVTAACYLSRFTEKYDWAHLDIAGTAWKSGAAKGATGRPVPLLAQFLMDRAG